MKKKPSFKAIIFFAVLLIAVMTVQSAENQTPVNNPDEILKYGEKLWNDPKLGTAGVSCGTCHPDGAGLKPEPYPKFIKMPNKAVTLEEMINFCMITPMKAKPLASNSNEMTALAAYVMANTKGETAAAQPCGSNPCTMKNPCGKNPCDKNPCAMKNPCGKNTCAVNPCTAKNPCGKNPCAYNPCASNPCTMKNPCTTNPCAKNVCTPANPCGKNACGVNPCAMINPCGMK